jgi:HEAT repeat protein
MPPDAGFNALLRLAHSTYNTRMNSVIARLLADLDDPDPIIRAAAADALGQFSAEHGDLDDLHEHGVPALIAALDDEHREVRWAAAYALGVLGDPLVIAPLTALYDRSSDDDGLRLVIVKALGKTQQPTAVPTLITTLRSADSRCIRTASARSLRRIATPEALHALEEVTL